MRCLLVGNYGVGNIGDEALREYFLAHFPEIEWQVVSARPREGELWRLPAGMRSFLYTPWARTLTAMRSCDAVVFGGGTLFTDGESVWACIVWGIHAGVARLFRRPILLAFQGVGPFRTPVGTWIARRVVASASFVSVRDPLSLARIESWNLHTEIIQTFDPVLSTIEHMDRERSKKVLVLIPRRNSGRVFFQAVDTILETRPFDEVIVASLQPDDPQELAICNACAKRREGTRIILVRSLGELGHIVADATLVITHRYHGAVAALALGREVILCPQTADDKLSSLEPLFAIPTAERFALLRERVRIGESRLREALGQWAK